MKARELFDVDGQIALVTGAASGLGLAMAEVMAENGAHVTMVDMDGEGLETAVARLRDAGFAVEPAVLDVTDADALRRAVDGAAERSGRLDTVFANAGISAGPGFPTPVGHLAAVERATWERVLDVNLTAVFETIRAAAVHMKAQRSGRTPAFARARSIWNNRCTSD